MPTPIESEPRDRRPLLAALLITTLTVACEAEEPSVAFRDHDGHDCTVETGDFGGCVGPKCAIEQDFVIRCPGHHTAEGLQLAINDLWIWGSFMPQGESAQAFRVIVKNFKFIDPLPGKGFAGQAVDGTIYRYGYDASYLWSRYGGTWNEVQVEGLPADFYSDYGFRVRPDGLGGLHAELQTGLYTGPHLLATLQGGQWSWTAMGSWDPNTGDAYAGVDELNRGYSLIWTMDWDPGPETLLRFSHWDITLLGPSDELGRVAAPARPVSGGIPIALLRQQDQGLELLAIDGSEDYSVSMLADTERISGLCPSRYNPVAGVCPELFCTSNSSGVERGAYQLARTTGGQLWGAWFVTEAEVEVEYSLSEGGIPRCLGTVSANASGTLHLAALAEDGTSLRALQLPMSDIGFDLSAKRQLAIAAYRHRVALLFPSRHEDEAGGELEMRLLVFDTSDID